MSDRLAYPSLEGHEIGGCRLVRRLSTGGMGAVYLARQHRLGDRYVAVKVIPLDDATLGPSHEPLVAIEQRFVREGKLLGHLSHPHILPVHDAGAEGNLLYLIMQYAPDGSLMDAIRGRAPHPLLLPLPLPFALDLLGQVASALQFIHQHGIVHRDVKPSNILVHVESEGHWHLMLADFGIARAAESTAQQHLLAGTLAYMAPEQFHGFYSPASDQYALAVVAYLLLTGHLPYDGNAAAQIQGHLRGAPAPPRASNPSVPPAVESVILRALAKQPSARYPSVGAFMSALRFAATSDAATTRSGITAPLPPLPLPASPLLLPQARRRAAIAPPEAEPLATGPQPGMSTTEADSPSAPPVEPAPARPPGVGSWRRPLYRRRRVTVLLACLALVLLAIAAGFIISHAGQTANGPRRPSSPRVTGVTAVVATATPTAIPASSSSGAGPVAQPTAATNPPGAAGAGGAQSTPVTVPPASRTGTPGPSVAVPNAAQVVAQPAPTSAAPGQRYTVSLTLANTGMSTWRTGYGLLCDKSRQPQSSCAAGAVIPFNGIDVAPGQRVTVTLTLAAPATPGVYTSWWALEQNGQPFGAQDVLTRVTVGTAQPPGPSATPTVAPSPSAPAGS